jgi:hypothetical protein
MGLGPGHQPGYLEVPAQMLVRVLAWLGLAFISFTRFLQA